MCVGGDWQRWWSFPRSFWNISLYADREKDNIICKGRLEFVIQIEIWHLYHCYQKKKILIPYLENSYIVCCPIYILDCRPVSWITVQDFGTSAFLCHATRTSFEKIKVRNSFMHEINIDIGMFDLLKSFLIIIKKGEAWIDLWQTIFPSRALICLNPVLISKTTLLL